MEKTTNAARSEDSGEREEGIGTAAREAADSLTNLIRSELRLAKTEVSDASERLRSHLTQIAIFGAIAALSVLPLVAFIIIGLGDRLGGRYALSSLIVGVAFLGLGGMAALRAWQRLKKDDFSLPHTRQSLENERTLVSTRISDITEAVKRRRT